MFSHNRRPLAYFNKALCLMNLDLSINEKEYMVILMVVERYSHGSGEMEILFETYLVYYQN